MTDGLSVAKITFYCWLKDMVELLDERTRHCQKWMCNMAPLIFTKGLHLVINLGTSILYINYDIIDYYIDIIITDCCLYSLFLSIAFNCYVIQFVVQLIIWFTQRFPVWWYSVTTDGLILYTSITNTVIDWLEFIIKGKVFLLNHVSVLRTSRILKKSVIIFLRYDLWSGHLHR